jgi:phosphoribosylaminoimidazolecarboxamide formyltransferase/IMP cyclohydrolase
MSATRSKVSRVLISVWNKEGLVDFAQGLTRMGVEILSTGGTSKALREAGINVRDVSDLTGFPEILDGRVKTLHPKIFGGLLGLREKDTHVQQMQQHQIAPIDLVVVNLYPFETACANPNLPDDELIEFIDIGGSALLRAASKNIDHVSPLCDPSDYATVLKELQDNGGLSRETRWRLAAKSFSHTAHYDAVIAAVLRKKAGVTDFPVELAAGLRKQTDLRYGENPHQKAPVYAESGGKPSGVVGAKILQGKQVSFNNYMDCDSAWRLVTSFNDPACVVIKHNNPCGVAEDTSAVQAFRLAYGADSLSAFGGIVGFNRPVDAESAAELAKLFLECVIAPAYSPEAREILSKKTNLRLLEQPTLTTESGEWDIRRISGGYLVQDMDQVSIQEPKLVTRRAPSAEERASLLFAWKVAKQVKSNAIVLTRGRVTAGVGAGQMSRIDSLNVAHMKLQQQKVGANPPPLVMASDGFFPFRDTVDAAAKMGVTAIIQPGGSMRDAESVTAADEHGIAMLVTGVRHFRH